MRVEVETSVYIDGEEFSASRNVMETRDRNWYSIFDAAEEDLKITCDRTKIYVNDNTTKEAAIDTDLKQGGRIGPTDVQYGSGAGGYPKMPGPA